MHRSTWLLSVALIVASWPGNAGGAELSGGLSLGYSMAPGAETSIEAADFAEGLPFSLRLGLSYGRPEGGDAADARRVFINDATNGTPEASGRVWIGRLDLVRKLESGPLGKVRIYAGPRLALFKGNFQFIGGNEDFDVNSRHWGWGGGLEKSWTMTPSIDFVVGGGIDWFLDAQLEGHDTSYDPDGENDNPRNDYDYDDADEAIAQPDLEWRLSIGCTWTPGG